MAKDFNLPDMTISNMSGEKYYFGFVISGDGDDDDDNNNNQKRMIWSERLSMNVYISKRQQEKFRVGTRVRYRLLDFVTSEYDNNGYNNNGVCDKTNITTDIYPTFEFLRQRVSFAFSAKIWQWSNNYLQHHHNSNNEVYKLRRKPTTTHHHYRQHRSSDDEKKDGGRDWPAVIESIILDENMTYGDRIFKKNIPPGGMATGSVPSKLHEYIKKEQPVVDWSKSTQFPANRKRGRVKISLELSLFLILAIFSSLIGSTDAALGGGGGGDSINYQTSAAIDVKPSTIDELKVKLAEQKVQLAEQTVQLAEQTVQLAEQTVQLTEMQNNLTNITQILNDLTSADNKITIYQYFGLVFAQALLIFIYFSCLLAVARYASVEGIWFKAVKQHYESWLCSTVITANAAFFILETCAFSYGQSTSTYIQAVYGVVVADGCTLFVSFLKYGETTAQGRQELLNNCISELINLVLLVVECTPGLHRRIAAARAKRQVQQNVPISKAQTVEKLSQPQPLSVSVDKTLYPVSKSAQSTKMVTPSTQPTQMLMPSTQPTKASLSKQPGKVCHPLVQSDSNSTTCDVPSIAGGYHSEGVFPSLSESEDMSQPSTSTKTEHSVLSKRQLRKNASSGSQSAMLDSQILQQAQNSIAEAEEIQEIDETNNQPAYKWKNKAGAQGVFDKVGATFENVKQSFSNAKIRKSLSKQHAKQP